MIHWHRFTLAALLLMFLGAADAAELQVYPRQIKLGGARDSQRVIIQETLPNGVSRVIDGASMTFTDPDIAKIKEGIVFPLSDGRTRLVIRHNARVAEIPIVVQKAKDDPAISFHREVMPVLTRTGCNSGRCHGAARGKDGFQLSLFGYDAAGDHYRLTQEISGRRINLALPDESLLLRKATGSVMHTGGKRFGESSASYQLIRRWIDEGASLDEAAHSNPVSLELLPKQAVVLQGKEVEQPFTVIAHYDDKSTRDVTDLAVFMSNNETTVDVSDRGTGRIGAPGEAFVLARFGTITERAQVIVLPQDAEPVSADELPANNELDRLINTKLALLRIRPSELCSDEAFLRRVYIDLVGRTPTPNEYHDFMSGNAEGKRARLIDDLLERDDFVDVWTMKWGEMLRIRTANQVSYKALLGFHRWLRERIAANARWSEIAQEVLSANGGTFEHPPTNYYQVESNPQLIAENVAQVFMGMRIQCAKCHNHPFDRWTMDDYYGFADFFSQIGFKQSRDPREFVIYNKGQGEVEHFISSRDVQPKFLGGAKPDIERHDRRSVLGEWIASDSNPYFAQQMANLVWAHHFGRGIVEPIDDVRVSNPPSNPELLEELGRRFAKYDFNAKRLIREICNSHAYQRSTTPNESNHADLANYAKASVRRMRAEVLLDSIAQITGSADRFPRLPMGARSVQIADGAVSNYFLSTFGRAPRETVCACEVDVQPTLSQAFHLLNGETTNQKIQNGNRITSWLADGWTAERVIEELYIACFSREVTQDERSRLLAQIDPSNQQADLEDIFWALLNSKEFVFNH